MGETDLAFALEAVEEERRLQRLQRIARRHHPVDDIARHRAGELPSVIFGEAVIGHDRRHRLGERRIGDAPREPVAEPPVIAVRPDAAHRREGGIGPRVPGVEHDPAGIDHPADAGNGAQRIVRLDESRVARIVPFEEGAQMPALDQVVAHPATEIGKEALRGFRIVEDIRLVRALVHRRAAELGKPDRLGLRHPCRSAWPPRHRRGDRNAARSTRSGCPCSGTSRACHRRRRRSGFASGSAGRRPRRSTSHSPRRPRCRSSGKRDRG